MTVHNITQGQDAQTYSTPFDPGNISDLLVELDRWALVKLVEVPGKEKPEKVPFQARYTGKMARTDAPPPGATSIPPWTASRRAGTSTASGS